MENDGQELALKRNDRRAIALLLVFESRARARATFDTTRRIPDYRFAACYAATAQWSEQKEPAAAQWSRSLWPTTADVIVYAVNAVSPRHRQRERERERLGPRRYVPTL